MIEMLMTLFVISIILLVSVGKIPEYDVHDIDEEISNISYFFKSAQTRSIQKESAHIIIMDHENNGLIARSLDGVNVYEYNLTSCRLMTHSLKRFIYLSSGDTSAFGTVKLNCRGEDVRIVFQIQKGQFRIER